MYGHDILRITDPKYLRDLWLNDFAVRSLTPDEFTHIGKLCGALWLHSGDPAQPHAELTARTDASGVVIPGKCSDGFVDVLRVLRHANLCDILAREMWRKVRAAYNGPVNWVVGSDHAGATFSHSVAREFRAQHDFTEKGPDKTQLWKRFVIEPGEVVLQVEELMTTSGTLAAVRQGIRQGNPHLFAVTFAPVAAVLVHRSDVYEIEGHQLSRSCTMTSRCGIRPSARSARPVPNACGPSRIGQSSRGRSRDESWLKTSVIFAMADITEKNQLRRHAAATPLFCVS